ncbi:MAG: neutral zinc metallopeptidase [Cellulomonadaceae bacterium]|nr:neutral zinc metallopeptidase [Cellulomonadaceae bacterium]
MTFNEGGSFEGGRVRTRKGGAVAGGGIGILAIAAFLIYQFTGVDLSGAVSTVEGGQGSQEEGVVAQCSSADANADRECRLSATTQSLDAFWATQFDAASAPALPGVVSFDGQTSTGCGAASSSTGPFYCPPDQTIYIDLAFFDLLQSQYGASGGALAEEYVVAHEYGHHIQQITGVMDTADRQGTGPESDSVRVELQADCYAGLWAGAAATTVDPDTGLTFLDPITDAELADALSAAQAVGDDHIQAESGMGVNQESWTHGSSEQRQRWFTAGYEATSPDVCDTFAAAEL